jgi:TPP-dependent 2-oxoacid decarboxylase
VVAKTFVIHNTHDAAEMIDSAISTCLAESKPVYLEIPCNLTLQAIPAPCPMDDLRYQWNASDNRSMFTAIDHVLREIDHAQRPILIAGSKMRRAKALDEFMHLANALGCGVAVQPDAKGVINEEHTEYLGTYWGDISSCRELQQVVEGSDLVIFVGPQFSDYTTLGWSSPVEKSNSIVFSPSCVTVREARYHHVQMNTVLSSLAVRVPLKDGAKTEFNRLVEEAGGESACVPAKFQPMNLQTVSDECAQGNTLSELEMSGIAAPFNTPAKARQDTDGEGEHMAEGDHPSGRPAGIVSGLRAPFNTPNRSSESLPQTPNKGNGHRSRDPGTRTPLTVEGLTALLQEEVTRNTNTALLVETGDAWFIGQKLRLSANAWYYLQMQYGSTGWALGALLGIKMVRRNCRKVVALIGDGSFQTSCQALSTLVRHAIKATVLVLNNRGYSTETQSGGGVGADVAAYSTLQNWDYAGLCEVFKDHEPITAASKSSGDLTAEEKEEQREEQADRSKRSRALGLRATTSEELQKALHRSDEFDGVVLIQCELAATDCSPEMTTFRQIVAQSSMRI